MSDYSVKRIEDMEAVVFGSFVRARAELGVESWGMQVLEIPAGATQYPEHDHAETGQEEVFVVLKGAGEIEIDGERHPLDTETMVRVGPNPRRKLWPGDDVLDEALCRGLHRGELEFLLGAEVGEQPALAHAKLAGQAADGQALEPVARSQVDRAIEDRRACGCRLGRHRSGRTG